MKNRTKRIALSGVLSALAVIIMSLGSIITTMDMTAAYMAGIAVMIARIELDRASAVSVYIVSGLLAFVLLPYKSVAVMFICYGGIYPIIKELCEKIPKTAVQWAAKLVLSNVLLSLMIWLCKFFVSAGDDPLGFELWVYILGNFVFVVYDILLTLIVQKYYIVFKRKH